MGVSAETVAAGSTSTKIVWREDRRSAWFSHAAKTNDNLITQEAMSKNTQTTPKNKPATTSIKIKELPIKKDVKGGRIITI